MEIVRSNGKREPVELKKIQKKIKDFSEGYQVDPTEISRQVAYEIADGITTEQIDNLTANICARYNTIHPDYSKLAGKFITERFQRKVKTFRQTTEDLWEAGLLNSTYYNFVKQHYSTIKENLVKERDYYFDHFGIRTLEKGYLLRINDKIVETPQYMFMRVAFANSRNVEEALNLYEALSQRYISNATPILFNSGTTNNTLISCNLITSLGDKTTEQDPDSIEGLHHTYYVVNKHSSRAAGIGLNLTPIRSRKSTIKTSGGKAAGILRQLKVYNEMAKTYNQSGKRPGSYAIYLEAWHKDVFDFLEAKRPHKNEELIARDLFFGFWVPDLFMRQVKNESDWYLFCPHEIEKAGLRPLYLLHGKEFEKEYWKAVDMGLGEKVSAMDVWKKYIESLVESGTPYLLFKDNVNKHNMQRQLGVITQSNLCVEIQQVTTKENWQDNVIANCCLSAVVLPMFVKNGQFQYDLLRKYVGILTRQLNNVIDKNDYPTEEARIGGLEQRAIGLGVVGLADVYGKLQLDYGSDKAREINKRIFENIYYAALDASSDIAQEQGIKIKSDYNDGKLHFDTFENVELTLDWDSLRNKLKQQGVANSLVTAPMPTASTSQIMGVNECFEPYKNNIQVRETKAGNYTVVNPHLVRDLTELGVWNQDTVDELIHANGDIKQLNLAQYNIPQNKVEELEKRYQVIWNRSQKELINQAAERAPFVDQSQSMNLWLPPEKATASRITSMLFYGWELGLKTGLYYLRTKANAEAQKSLAVQKKKKEKPDIQCFGCES